MQSQSAAHAAGISAGVIAMIVVVVSSNYLVNFPINDFLTWGAFTYPFAFLVTDLTNRRLGPAIARRVVYVGFALAVVLSIYFADVRIAIASGTAFLLAQLSDVYVFDRLRRQNWWKAPLVSSALGSTLDTALFFSIAFVGTEVPWVTLAIGDLGVKLAFAATMLLPYRLLQRQMGEFQAA
ncbi:MAG: VUT family protein [Pseudomonadota bacterium]